MVIANGNKKGIVPLKQYLSQKFQSKDLEQLRYFLGIEFAHSKNGCLVISQKICFRHSRRIMDVTRCP